MSALAPLDLFRYVPRRIIELAENVGDGITVTVAPDTDSPVFSAPPENHYILGFDSPDVTSLNRYVTLLAVRSLHLFLKQGPVVAQPGEELCQDLLDTEIRLDLADVRMPFPVVALEFPRAIAGPHPPYLVFVWQAAPDRLCVWTYLADHERVLHQTFAARQSIEATIAKGPAQSLPDDEQYGEVRRLMIRGMRAALNVVLVMAHQGFDLEPLPARTARNRASTDGRLRRLSRRQPQRIILRHLRPRSPAPAHAPAVGGLEPGSARGPAPHRVKGHWKRQVVGEGRQDRKLIWLEPYWTGGGGPSTPPTIIYRD